jgi:hypothetical protein
MTGQERGRQALTRWACKGSWLPSQSCSKGSHALPILAAGDCIPSMRGL